MGPKVSTTTTNQEIVKINHQRFNNTKFIKGQNEEQFISIALPVANQKQYQIWAKRLTQVPNSETLMLPVSHQFKKQGFCGSSGLVNITYDNFPFLLSDQISNRQCLNKKLFEQNQLWYLVYTLLSSSEGYHNQGRKIGDIRPDNIFINEDGQVKVATQDSWPGQQTNYSKSFYQKQITYLSPQQIKDYQFGKMEESANLQLAETFSIGLTCLDAATLSDSKNFYSKNFKFDYNKLQQKLKQFRQIGYSKLLTLTIQNMCEVDAENRSRCRQILNWLKPHQQAIVNLEDFQVNGLPQKMLLAQQRAVQNSNIGSSIKAPLGTNSTYIPQSGPFTYQQFVPNSISTYQQPVKVSQYYPPPSIVNNGQGQPQTQIVSGSTFQINNPSFNAPTGYQSGYVGPDDHKSALQKIDEQLNLSRKMFPS